jgi:hypothetical protein
MSDQKILKQYENIALSDKELKKIVDGKASIVLYPNLIHYKNMDEVLGPHEACFLLFEAKPHYGHWCLIFKVNENTLEFFNPYGGYPDDSLNHIPMHYRVKSNQLHTILSELMLKSPYELTYNEFPFQEHNPNTKTCGRWCAFRLICRNMSLYQFKEFIDSIEDEFGLNGDELVTLATINYAKPR